jgi:hypothetical protein
MGLFKPKPKMKGRISAAEAERRAAKAHRRALFAKAKKGDAEAIAQIKREGLRP